MRKILKISGFCIIAYGMLWISRQVMYTTVPIKEVDSATSEIVIEYRDNLYAAFVDDVSSYEVGNNAKVLMKSSMCWDFELSPTLDIIYDIK